MIETDPMGAVNLVVHKIAPRGRPKKRRPRFLRNPNPTADQILWDNVRNRNFHGLRFRHRCELGQYISDFFCHEKRLSIELYGHLQFERSDLLTFEKISNSGNISLYALRVTDKDILENLDSVMKRIEYALESLKSER